MNMRLILRSLIWLGWILTVQPQSSQGAEPKYDDLESIERHAQRVFEMASPAVVKITEGLEDEYGWSGVIATADGYVVSCEHHGMTSGEQVFVHLSDGRRIPARTLGSLDSLDIGLFQILDSGPWPRVEFGKSTQVKLDDLCVAIGYPRINKPDSDHTPTVRLGRIVFPDATPYAVWSSCRIMQGDSGGGLFDLNGRLVGVCSGSSALTRASARHVGIELFERHWNDLVESKRLESSTADQFDSRAALDTPWAGRVELSPKLGSGKIDAEFHELLESVPSVAVEVLCDREQKVLGTIVGPEGWVLTKSSEVFGDLTIRLVDGREMPARIFGTDHEHDLALLKVSGIDLPQIRWRDGSVPRTGSLVAATGCQQKPGTVGILSHPGREIPPERGTIIGSIEIIVARWWC